MNIKINEKEGISLKTKGKYCDEDINVSISNAFVKPSGTLNITSNGTFDVTEKKNVSVNVSGIQPSGTIEITENGVVDVTNYANANVNVASSGGENTFKTLIQGRKNAEYLFYNYQGKTPISDLIEYDDTTNVSAFNYCFYGSNITEMPNINTQKLNQCSNMFQGSNLSKLPIIESTNWGYTCSSMFYGTKITNIGHYIVYGKNCETMFCGCQSLLRCEKLELPLATNVSGLLNACSLLEYAKIILPNTSLSMTSFAYGCSNLKILDVSLFYPSSTSSTRSFVTNCNALKSLIFREFGAKNSLTAGAFDSSGISSGTGYIYVPRAMVDTLKSATNWSTYADQIRALEDYTIDGTTTGALDESKLV